MKVFSRLSLRLWLPIKLVLSGLFDYRRYKVEEEINFMERSSLNPHKIDWSRKGLYRDDKLFGKTQFDWQLDAINLFVRGGDCNSIHRLWQVWYHIQGYTAYLITLKTKPFKNSHSFVVFQKPLDNGAIKWFMSDYGDEIELDSSFNVALTKLKEIYPKLDKSYTKGVQIKAMALQDINFKVIKVV